MQKHKISLNLSKHVHTFIRVFHLFKLFPLFCFVLQRAFFYFFVQYLGVTAGIEPATQQCIPGALTHWATTFTHVMANRYSFFLLGIGSEINPLYGLKLFSSAAFKETPPQNLKCMWTMGPSKNKEKKFSVLLAWQNLVSAYTANMRNEPQISMPWQNPTYSQSKFRVGIREPLLMKI